MNTHFAEPTARIDEFREGRGLVDMHRDSWAIESAAYQTWQLGQALSSSTICQLYDKNYVTKLLRSAIVNPCRHNPDTRPVP
jgi:hypothetical protein